MAGPGEKRGSVRVAFEASIEARMMAVDGTWHRPCRIQDISDAGAKLTLEDSIERLPLTEFFLVLSSTGVAYRHCNLVWINGNEIGVAFLHRKSKKPRQARIFR